MSSQWANLTKSDIVVTKLHLLTSTPKVLAREGYVLKLLTERNIWAKNRCRNCGQRLKRYQPLGGEGDLLTFEDHEQSSETPPPAAEEAARNLLGPAVGTTQRQKHYCIFHDGQTFKGVYQCCGGRFNTKGCCSEPNHVACDLNEVRAEWLYHKTPHPAIAQAPSASHHAAHPGRAGHQNRGNRGGRNRYINPHTLTLPPPAPSRTNNKDIRAAVALDCEMGTSVIGNSVLIRLSVVDLFTGLPLINSLVAPTVDMAHYNTRYSGVTFSAMRIAKQQNQAIRGTDAARNQLLRFVDSDTFIIMHGGSSDLTALRIIHPAERIIDTHVLESYEHSARELKKSLKDVCARRCGIEVQNARLGDGRVAGHDSLEDALAAREIVCAWVRDIPDT